MILHPGTNMSHKVFFIINHVKLLLIHVFFLLCACAPSGREGMDEAKFSNYWYQGKAEVNVFDLQQSRYGEVRPGKAVMIFVTEDFSKSKQVKLDDPEQHSSDAQKVLKLNMTREFVTGVYPYHTMLSVFTPIYEDAVAPKLSASVTEWCGQSFTQLNFKNGKYTAQQFSYFESEGDQEQQLDAQTEEELFTLIRLNPDLVPLGNVILIPSLIFQRFSHHPLQVEQASLSRKAIGSDQAELNIAYIEIGRKVSIRYQQQFPYEITGFTETWTNEKGEQEVTTATRTSLQLLAYWQQNGKIFEPLRKELGL
ncbi:MAG: hypothetical protein ACK5BR_06705 [Bacteroidota bacterium]|jgi:hypothetical protein|nr:hypothetical protein [Algoriphagus sp.]